MDNQTFNPWDDAHITPPHMHPDHPYPLTADRIYQLYQRKIYPRQVWGFVAAGILFLVFLNAKSILQAAVRKRRLERDPPRLDFQSSSSNVPLSKWHRLFHAVEAPFGWLTFLHIPFGTHQTITLFELLAVLVYIGALFTWSFVNSQGGQKPFWNQRTAAIAFKQFPFITLLSGKNNLIGYVTGISHTKINFMHRMVARANMLLIFCHAFSKIPSAAEHISKPKFVTGIIAAIVCGVLFLASLRPFRKSAYDLFLPLHGALVVSLFAAAYVHSPGNGLFILIAIAFWILDRLLRLLRMYTNQEQESSERGSKSSRATLEIVSPDAIRVTLPRHQMRWKPGQFVYLTMPAISSCPLEAHPFTIASPCQLPTLSEKGDVVSESKETNGSDMVFLVRARGGFTRRLFNFVQLHPGSRPHTYIDGPYGVSPPIHSFSTIVLIAGGSGVSATMPLLHDIIRASNEGSTPVRRVLFIWCISIRNELEWIADPLEDLLHQLPDHLKLEVRIHITRINGLRVLVENAHHTFPITPMPVIPIIHPTTEEAQRITPSPIDPEPESPTNLGPSTTPMSKSPAVSRSVSWGRNCKDKPESSAAQNGNQNPIYRRTISRSTASTISISEVFAAGSISREDGDELKEKGDAIHVKTSPVDALTILSGRPDLVALIDEEIEQAEGPMSIHVAGPSNLINNVRNALRTTPLIGILPSIRGRQPVTLFTGEFSIIRED